MTPHRVPEVSGASPGAADGPRRAAAGSPGGVKGPSRSACGTLPGDCPRSICCSPRRSRFQPCASPQKTSKMQTFLSQCHLAEVLDHMCFLEWERYPPFSLSCWSRLCSSSRNRLEMAGRKDSRVVGAAPPCLRRWPCRIPKRIRRKPVTAR